MRRAGWLAAVAAAWLALVFAWIWRGPPEQDAPRADYAVVLGAAVDGAEPSAVFSARIDHAIALWRAGQVQGLVFTGGRGPGDSLSEAEAARAYAMARGVPAQAITVETQSRTTLQNLAGVAAMRQVDAATWLIVSDPLHLQRAMTMARDLGYDAQPAAAPGTRYRSLSTKVPFALRELYFIHHYWALGE